MVTMFAGVIRRSHHTACYTYDYTITIITKFIQHQKVKTIETPAIIQQLATGRGAQRTAAVVKHIQLI